MFARSLFLAIVLSCAFAGDVPSSTIKRRLDPVTEVTEAVTEVTEAVAEAIKNTTQATTETLENIVPPANADAAAVLPDLGIPVNATNINIPGVSDAFLNATNVIKAATDLLNSSMPALPNIPIPPIFDVADTKVAESVKATDPPTPSPTTTATPAPTPGPSAAIAEAEKAVEPTVPEKPGQLPPLVGKEGLPATQNPATPDATPFIQEDPKEVVHDYFDFWPMVWAAAVSIGLLALACLLCCVCRDYRKHRAPALDSARGRVGSLSTQYLDI